MDKISFASYEFKPSDVIEGLNRYFAETKAYRYRRVSLEIRNGVWTGNPDYRKDVVFINRPPDRNSRSGHVCWKYYLICDPEEVVGVAINWLREEHDIFYTPGMEATREDRDIFCKKILGAEEDHDKETRTSDIFCEGNLDMVPVVKVREALGIAEDSDIFECIEYRNRQLETLRDRLVVKRRMYDNAIDERNKFGRRLRDIREASGMADDDRSDLVEYIETLRKSEETYEDLYKQYEKMYSELRDAKFTKLSAERTHYKRCYESLNNGILEVYREIFDCSNGDPEGTIKETLQDILTEYKRCLELKNVAEEKTIKYKELARENEEKLAKEKEWTKRLEQKLIEIQDVCER